MHLLRHTAGRQARGYILITDQDGEVEEYETLQCRHCQMHWRVLPGSGRQRGWCFRCAGPTCGKQSCERECVPWELELERIETAARRQSSLDAAIAHSRAL